jgi:hypothetical protein
VRRSARACRGWALVGKGVDDGNPGVAGQLLHRAVQIDAGGDALHEALQVLGDVPHGLPLADAHLLLVQVKGVPPQVDHGHLEGGPGAQGGLFEEEGQGLAP